VFFWHHSDRAAFGLITLAFVASGLVLRNSGGFLDSPGGGPRESQPAATVQGHQLF
jgi:hypothetical protein